MVRDDLPLYPLKFQPLLKPKVWGGRSLEKLGKKLPGDAATTIGESWELADLMHSSVSGGGGGSQQTLITNGPLTGQSLRDLINLFGERLVGKLQLDPDNAFPLLVKFLDAQQNLSVQVHPSPQYARSHPQAHLKSEAWYIVDARPGSAIYKGIHEGVTPEQFRSAIASNDQDAIEKLLIRVPVKPGDCHYLPSGTCHALGAGILVAEVQTPSDTTFRVYDWGRTDRELHVEQAMQCIHFGPPDVRSHERRTHIAGMFTTVSRLVLCDHFRVERIRMSEAYEQEIPYDQPAVWIVLKGEGAIEPGNGAANVSFTAGETMLIPAHMSDAKVKLTKDTTWLEITFPQAMPEQIA